MFNRKTISVMLAAAALASALTLAGCGSKKPSGTSDIKPSNSQSSDSRPANNEPVAATDPALNVEKTEYIFTPEGVTADKGQLSTCFLVIKNRLFCMNISGNVSIKEDLSGLTVAIPENAITDELMKQLTRKGALTIRKGDKKGSDGAPEGEIVITNSDIDKAKMMMPAGNGDSYGIGLELKEDAVEKFADVTGELAGTDTPLSIWLDDELLYSPKVTAKISDGNIMISGNFTMDEAGDLVGIINSGALPFGMSSAKA